MNWGGVLKPTVPLVLDQEVYFDDFLATPTTGQIRIQRSSDNYYYDGTNWVSSENWISTTVNGQKHRYTFTPTTDLREMEIFITMRINSDVNTEKSMVFTVEKLAGGSGASIKP